MLFLYHSLTGISAPALRRVLKTRLKRGKEDPVRLPERMGIPGLPRPDGQLVWFHAASVGEAQSTLILLNALLDRFPNLHALVTTGTLTSAGLMADRLPPRAVHQFYPLDHPDWVNRFLNHWQPDLVLWMESELWPNMLESIRARNLLAVLVNARLSPRSLRNWNIAKKSIKKLLATFEVVLAQTTQDAENFRSLGAVDVRVRENLKYSALPLPCDETELARFKSTLSSRPCWVYASTHDGEEDLACITHIRLKETFPDLLTMIVPRHPERRMQILEQCTKYGLKISLRGYDRAIPSPEDDIYVADTMGDLGLFYRLSPVACIGRTFSNDGGGGHNPIEAAQLGCAVLHGPMTQNLSIIFEDMDKAGAALCVNTPDELYNTLKKILTLSAEMDRIQDAGLKFAQERSAVLTRILDDIEPLLMDSGIMKAVTQ